MVDLDRWSRVAAEPSPWIERLRLIAYLIEPGARVLDVGAGSQELAGLLPDGCTYQALDCVPGPGVLVCDLNGEPPAIPFRAYDVAVLAGVLEYLDAPARLLMAARIWARRVIFSYDHGATRAAGWRNSIAPGHFASMGAVVVGGWQDQTIYRLG